MTHYADRVTIRQIDGIPEMHAAFVGSALARMPIFDKFEAGDF
jgi:hypothetical protein